MKKGSTLPDEEIVHGVCKGDKELFAELIRRYQKKLLRYAGYLMSDDSRGADVVQEAFIKAYINLKSFDTKKNFSSWIYRITHNEAMNALSKKKHQPISDYDEIDDGTNLEEEFIRDEIINRAKNCLEDMPLIYKEPLSLFYLEDKSYEEISDILRIPIGTVGTRINRAKIIMKKLCQKI